MEEFISQAVSVERGRAETRLAACRICWAHFISEFQINHFLAHKSTPVGLCAPSSKVCFETAGCTEMRNN